MYEEKPKKILIKIWGKCKEKIEEIITKGKFNENT